MKKSITEITIMPVGFGFIGMMIGVAVWGSSKEAMAILIFAGMGAAFGAFLGLWGSVEADER